MSGFIRHGVFSPHCHFANVGRLLKTFPLHTLCSITSQKRTFYATTCCMFYSHFHHTTSTQPQTDLYTSLRRWKTRISATAEISGVGGHYDIQSHSRSL